MIYQMTIYYGAILNTNGQVVYSIENELTDCTKFPNNLKDLEEEMKCIIKHQIIKDGFNTENFTIGYLTKEQYNNRYKYEKSQVAIYKK